MPRAKNKSPVLKTGAPAPKINLSKSGSQLINFICQRGDPNVDPTSHESFINQPGLAIWARSIAVTNVLCLSVQAKRDPRVRAGCLETLFEIRTPLDGSGAPLTKILQALL